MENVVSLDTRSAVWMVLVVVWTLATQIQARAPLVSLTVSIIGNRTEEGGGSKQATFDRSDYAYPLPQTGFATFGFSGELYVPESAGCADEVVGAQVRRFEKPMHPNGVAFLPYRTCRTEWNRILHEEALAGRAAGALLYSLKDDAAQAAERTTTTATTTVAADPAYLQIPVWVVNAVAGEYLVGVMKQVYSDTPNTRLPVPPTSAEYQALQESVRLAIGGILGDGGTSGSGGASAFSPRVFVTISRSAADVATADRNFFLKAMVGVGITGIVCFVIAMVVRYFDCLRLGGRRLRGESDEWQHAAGAGGGFNGGGARRNRHAAGRWATTAAAGVDEEGARVFYHHYHHHHHSARDAHAAQQQQQSPGKRVLQQHELDLLPCMVVVSKRDLPRMQTQQLPNKRRRACGALDAADVHARGSEHKSRHLRPHASCPQLSSLACASSGGSTATQAEARLQRIYSSVNNNNSKDNVRPPETAATLNSVLQGQQQQHQQRAACVAGEAGDARVVPEQTTSNINTWDSGASSDGALDCAICLEEINEGEIIRKLPCPHVFHSACIDRWLLCQSSVCPLCKRDTTLFGASVALP
ncbi:hypothetical protein LPJ72_003745 [Coemansia sp. Benny D160-2]|nr:hypothetical protein LPJ72_003745 [Coemansia sp. Benny D160-2]